MTFISKKQTSANTNKTKVKMIDIMKNSLKENFEEFHFSRMTSAINLIHMVDADCKTSLHKNMDLLDLPINNSTLAGTPILANALSGIPMVFTICSASDKIWLKMMIVMPYSVISAVATARCQKETTFWWCAIGKNRILIAKGGT